MSHQELRDELMTLLVAGHETTASELAWAFELLPRHPHVLNRLTDEIDAGEETDYLDATINEVLRRRPVLPNAEPRLTMQPVTIGDWHYPEGVVLACSAYLVHHDPDDLSRPVRVQARALPRERPRHLHLPPLRRRPPALHRRELRAVRDARGPARAAQAGDDQRGRRRPRAAAAGARSR